MFDREKIKNFIEDNGFKQKHIAEKAGLTERTLSLVLAGKRKCNVEEYVAICHALNVPFDTFILENTLNTA